jgi:hypothetical protein
MIKISMQTGIKLSNTIFPRIVALAVAVVISVYVAGAAGAACAYPGCESPVVLVDIEPHGDNEHFGVTNVGTAAVDLGGLDVAIDNGDWITLPKYTLAPGEEANVLFIPEESANEPGEKDLYLEVPGFHLNDTAGRITLRDSTGIVLSELTYSHNPPESASPARPIAPGAPA